MRPALVALAAPALVLAAFLVAWGQGSPEAVRRAWSPWLAALLAFVGVLGPALLARGFVRRDVARGVVLAALAALGLFALLVLLAPLGPGETSESRVAPAVDAVAGGALVATAAIGRGPSRVHRHGEMAAVARGRWWPILAFTLAAAVVARGIGLVASGVAVGVVDGGTLAAALLWGAAALLAASLAAARLMLAIARRA